MPVTITFNKISEKTPAHGEDIIYLHQYGSYDRAGFEPKNCTVEYSWSEVDSDGCHTGNMVSYNYEDELIGHEIVVSFAGDAVNVETLWINKDDYWDCFK